MEKEGKSLVSGRELFYPESQVPNIINGFEVTPWKQNGQLLPGKINLSESGLSEQEIAKIQAKNEVLNRFATRQIDNSTSAIQTELNNRYKQINDEFLSGNKDLQSRYETIKSVPQLFDEHGKFNPIVSPDEDMETWISLYGSVPEELLQQNYPGFYPMVIGQPRIKIPVQARKNGGKFNYLNYFK